jgi:hypothetical protein
MGSDRAESEQSDLHFGASFRGISPVPAVHFEHLSTGEKHLTFIGEQYIMNDKLIQAFACRFHTNHT